MKRSFFKDISLSSITAGFLVVLISYAGPMLIFFQAAALAQVSNEVLSSWVWAVSFGGGISGIYLSWKYKMPIITAWSAPGAALLIALFPHMSVNEAISSYITAAMIILLIGITGISVWYQYLSICINHACISFIDDRHLSDLQKADTKIRDLSCLIFRNRAGISHWRC
jgi:predicted benzoate:H+ symporter BenE